MSWWQINKSIPFNRTEFLTILNKLVFECPAAIRRGKTSEKIKPNSVSARECSFHQRNITRDLLTTLLSQIRGPMLKIGTYAVVKPHELVNEKVDVIIETTALADPNFDLMVFQTRSDMPDSEAVFYYIRNAFAHGSFDVTAKNGIYIYNLESSNYDKKTARMRITAQMRLKEATLLRYAELSNLTASQIKRLQKPKKQGLV